MPISIAPFLSEKALDNINGHKYKPSELTPLDAKLAPWLNKMVECFPLWFAPNLVTISGVGPVLISLWLLFRQCPTATELAPQWILLFFSLSASFYIIMDALDGKQARRTGTSSPLGQLFDHGVDCMTMLPYTMFCAAAACVGGGRLTLACQISAHIGFFLAQWQEHHTGIMATKFGPIGVTEIGFGMAGAVMFLGLIEPQARCDFASGILVNGVPRGDAFAYCWIAFALCLSVCSFATVFSHVRKRGGFPAIVRAALDLLPMVFLLSGTFAWSDATLLAHSRVISFLTAILAFLFTAQMILSSMALVDYQWAQPMALPHVIVALLSSMLAVETSGVVVNFLTAFALVVTSWWLIRIIRQLKQRLGVRMLHVGKRNCD